MLGTLLDDDPDDFLVIRDALRDHGDRSSLAQKCRDLLGNERERPDRRLRAGMTLAGLLSDRLAPEDSALRGAAGFLADQCLVDLLAHPDRYNDWLAALRPAGPVLVPPLESVFRDPRRADGNDARFLAATILAKFVAGEPERLTDLLLDADTRQFPVILTALSGFQSSVIPRLTRMISEVPPVGAAPDARYSFVKRQANAAIGLLHCGDEGSLWPLLRHSPDPLLRTYLVDRLHRLTPDPQVLVNRLGQEGDVSVRRALILILGGIPASLQSGSWTGPAAEALQALYQNDPDPGIHSAAQWALHQLHRDEVLKEADTRIAGEQATRGRLWYVTRTGHHEMAILPGPIEFKMGSDNKEPGRDRDEVRRSRTIPRTFSIATKEVTARQFLEFKAFERFPNEACPERDCPINVIQWLDAVAYCRWLSEQEHVPEEQMCYPPQKDIRPGMTPYPDYLSRTGYRLPTEAEWEYACRALAVTSRFIGNDPVMLDRYDWFINNSEGMTHRVGSLLPNDFGLFDVLGNVREWCQETYKERRDGRCRSRGHDGLQPQ